jgi:hypothetical protein
MLDNDYDYDNDNDNDNEPPRDFCTAPLVNIRSTHSSKNQRVNVSRKR